MAFGRRNDVEIKTEETKIWECISTECNCWVRDNFKNKDVPSCPLCGSDMESTTKVLSVVENNSFKG